MRHLLRSGDAGVRARGSRSLALAALGLCAVMGLTAARSTHAVPTPVVVDTVARPLQFRKTSLFSPEYLFRLAEAESRKRQAVTERLKQERVEMFARRYSVSLDLARKIHDTALAEGVDPDLAFRLVRTESRFQPRARGPRGALGLTQLMPATARAVDRSLRTEAQILEPTANLRVGFRYLRQLIERYDGDVRLALLAYNRGHGTVDRALRSGRDPENGYSRKVLGTRSNPYEGSGLIEREAR